MDGWYNPLTNEAFPRLQNVTLAELFQGKRPRIPNVDRGAIERAKREEMGKQDQLI